MAILGAALSGAGPSVLIFLDPRASLQKTRRTRHRLTLRDAGLAAELIPTSITSVERILHSRNRDWITENTVFTKAFARL